MNEIETKYWDAMVKLIDSGIDSMFQNDVITYDIKNIGLVGSGTIRGIIYLRVNNNEDKLYDITFSVRSQARAGRYILDFIFEALGNNEIPCILFAIEIDGHDFHEKTKEQVRRDKTRERELIASGYIIIRYTGSEVFHDSYYCAVDTVNTIVEYIYNTGALYV